jgi:hypothetical protein
MSKNHLIRIIKKPEKPIRKENYVERILIKNDDNLEDIINLFDVKDLKNINIQFVYSEADYLSIYFVYKGMESENHYQERLKNYQIKLEEYNKWYKENKELIEKELKLKEEKKERNGNI